MKHIYTLTLNPALDKSTSVERVEPEQKLRCENPKFEPGGGGINISRALQKLGGHSIAIYPKGGPTGEHMQLLLDKEGIKQYTIPSQNWNRENFIVVEESTNKQFRFGMPGPALLSSEVDAILKYLNELKEIDFFIVSGSIPEGVPTDFYKSVAKIVNSKTGKFILDTSGKALEEALKEGVYLCKPNIGELAQLVGQELDTIPKQEAAALKVLNDYKVEILVVSLGPFGAFLATKEKIYHVAAPSVNKKSTVGAGDSMVAGMIFQLAQGKSLFEVLKYGIATGTAATMNSGTELCKKEDVESLYQWITKHHMENGTHY
ncbi:MAG TPA: 1-phosphofructokinase family hexose kinase [Cytophagaceae bacterium]|jgi:6-phosphofructokinase 2|nr:1-phosphofructokinase family hexose kinase [Cytophagaceae bacterium]